MTVGNYHVIKQWPRSAWLIAVIDKQCMAMTIWNPNIPVKSVLFPTSEAKEFVRPTVFITWWNEDAEDVTCRKCGIENRRGILVLYVGGRRNKVAGQRALNQLHGRRPDGAGSLNGCCDQSYVCIPLRFGYIKLWRGAKQVASPTVIVKMPKPNRMKT